MLTFCQARARSARARRACALRALGLLLADGTPTVGGGEDFLSRQPIFFTETAVNSGNGKSKNRSQGGKLTVMLRAKNGSSTKIGVVWQKSVFLGQKPKFWAKKKAYTFGDSPCSGHDQKKLFKEKSAFAQIIKGGECHLG